MIKNFIKIAIRNLIRQKTFSIVNITGLAIGIASSLFILLFVSHELSYDNFHEDIDRLYRVGVKGRFGGGEFDQAVTAQPMAAALLQDYPEIENVARIREFGDWMITYEDKKYHEENFLFADSTFFEIFDFKLLQGDPSRVLDEPRSVVMTERIARKYFGDEDPVGKMIKLERDTILTKVTGVMEDVPGNSHIHFDMVGAIHTYTRGPRPEQWVNHNYYTYILLKEGIDPDDLERKLEGVIEKYVGPTIVEILGMSLEEMVEQGSFFGYHIDPMKDIHLDSNLDYEFEPNGNKTLVYIFLVVALLILVVACINFMNLSTARASGRAKEVGIRKLLGAQKPSLIGQFLSESTLITILAFIMGLIIVLLLMTPFNNLIGIELNTDILKGWILVPIIIGLVVFVGVFSGSYPAFFLAAFKPVQVLKGTIVRGTRSGKLRSMLVVLQLGVSVFILVGTFITFGQMRFLLNKDPGFDKENVLVIRRSDVLREQIETFKQELRKNPNILNAANSNSIPGRNFSNNATWTEEKGASETYLSWHSWVTAEYAETFSLEMAEGRFFSKEYPTDSFAVVINEAAINMLGLDEPVLEQNLLRPSGPQTFEPVPIIGVVKDFHFQSLHESIQPMCLFMIPGNWEGYIPVKITSDIPGTVQYIKQTWESFTTEYPFDYFWMEDDYKRLYLTETRTSDIFVAFAIISLLVACLGLIGLISFTAVQRTKEIGIRKAMGSNSNSVVLLFAREISILIMASTLLASPIWFAIKAWLQKFAFHISFNLIIFIGVLLAAGLITLILSWISVGGIAINASRKNPADSLRYE